MNVLILLFTYAPFVSSESAQTGVVFADEEEERAARDVLRLEHHMHEMRPVLAWDEAHNVLVCTNTVHYTYINSITLHISVSRAFVQESCR